MEEEDVFWSGESVFVEEFGLDVGGGGVMTVGSVGDGVDVECD